MLVEIRLDSPPSSPIWPPRGETRMESPQDGECTRINNIPCLDSLAVTLRYSLEFMRKSPLGRHYFPTRFNEV